VKIAAALGVDAFEGDAHALLAAVYKDPAQPMELRMEAAKAAIGYEKPRLAAIDGNVDATLSWAKIVEEVAEERLRRGQQGASEKKWAWRIVFMIVFPEFVEGLFRAPE
jgi:hypothetical protein